MGKKAEKDRDWREREEKSTKSNGFEEHDSNQFLQGKKEEGGGERRKEKVGGERGMGSVDMKGFP